MTIKKMFFRRPFLWMATNHRHIEIYLMYIYAHTHACTHARMHTQTYSGKIDETGK